MERERRRKSLKLSLSESRPSKTIERRLPKGEPSMVLLHLFIRLLATLAVYGKSISVNGRDELSLGAVRCLRVFAMDLLVVMLFRSSVPRALCSLVESTTNALLRFLHLGRSISKRISTFSSKCLFHYDFRTIRATRTPVIFRHPPNIKV